MRGVKKKTALVVEAEWVAQYILGGVDCSVMVQAEERLRGPGVASMAQAVPKWCVEGLVKSL